MNYKNEIIICGGNADDTIRIRLKGKGQSQEEKNALDILADYLSSCEIVFLNKLNKEIIEISKKDNCVVIGFDNEDMEVKIKANLVKQK